MKRKAARAPAFAAFAALLAFAPVQAADPAATIIRSIELAQPFHARSPWKFVATQRPDDRTNPDWGPMPGKVTVCLTRSSDHVCSPAIRGMEKAPSANYDEAWEPHYLKAARIVYPRGQSAAPLLLLRTSSLPSAGDGEAAVFTQLVAYRRGEDRFEAVFSRLVFHNNNEEVRFIEFGPLQGDVVVVEPTNDAPFGYWVAVSHLAPNYTYHQVLRYRSATTYGDNNPLAVIDSEMPNIQQRLGLWRPGRPLPLPAKTCPKPRLVKMELWCS